MNEAQVRAILTKMGWQQDRFGHFKSKQGTVRVKIQAVSIRVERAWTPSPSTYDQHPAKQWLLVVSDYMKNLTLNDKDNLVIKGRGLVRQ